MSKSSNSKRITRLLFVFVVSLAVVCADLVVLAQNENAQDDTTRGGQMTSNTQNGNVSGNTGNTGTGGRRRRRRRSSAGGNANAGGGANVTGDVSANVSADPGGNVNAGATVTTGGRRRRRRRSSAGAGAAVTTGDTTAGATMTANNMGGEQTDLSGTYTGTVDYPEGGLSANGTLTITGNNFTITPEGGGASVSGRVTAVTTRGYTAVTMMFGDPTPPAAGTAPPPLPAVSLRARRSGNRVTLTSVPGEKRKFTFSATAGGTGGTGSTGGRRRRRRSRNRMSNIGGAGATTTTNTSGAETNTNTTTNSNTPTTPPQ